MGHNILVLEDSPSAMMDTVNKLREQCPNAKIIKAKNYQEAERAVDTHSIDLALVDLHLPDKSGIDFILNKLKSDSKTSSIPVIVISTVDTSSFIGDLIIDKVDKFLPKPVDPELLASTLRELEILSI